MFFNSSLIYCDYNREYYENTISHSDQGWQYQHQYYHQFLEDKGTPNRQCHVRGIVQTMA